jgi:DHA2 family methylenomycin A resistance protein-like MFS transporter
VPGRPRRADSAGQLLGIAALAVLTTVLIEPDTLTWVAAAVLAVAFFCTERRSPVSMVPLSLFRDRTFAAGSAVGLLINLGFYGQLFVATLYFQDLRGYSALATGLALLPETAMASVGSILSGRIMARTGPRLPTVAGLALGAAGMLGLVAEGSQTTYWVLVAPMMAAGLGNASGDGGGHGFRPGGTRGRGLGGDQHRQPDGRCHRGGAQGRIHCGTACTDARRRGIIHCGMLHSILTS